ncbi:MAG: AzlD domain-containing protein, partial [Actinomycetota bacterium]|nr:AzlD domain-containing protein [Actinomycetota bacterium]
LLTLLPLSIVASVVAVQVATTGRTVVLDARVVGVGLAAVLAWKRVPLGVVVLAAAGATAATRAAGWG